MSNKQKLLAHVTSLTFTDVPVVPQTLPNCSNIGYCHQNCLNYQQLNPGTRIVRGWIEKNYTTQQKKEYVIHSVLEVNGKLIDPTPWDLPYMRGKFAEDPSIVWIDTNVKDWEFHITEFGKLPTFV